MINVLAIDDEPLALKQLVKCIETMPFLNLAGTARDAFEAMQFLAENKVDAVFLDINMPGMDGLSLIRTLPNPPLVVFTTAYAEYAVDSYKVDAVDYLLKPFTLEDFQRASFKLLTAKGSSNPLTKEVTPVSTVQEQQQPAYPLDNHDSDSSIVDDIIYLKSDYQRVRLDINTIRYVESMSEYLRIYTTDDRKPITTLLSMRRMEEVLPSSRFMRIHRSYIVALDKILSVQKLTVNMGDGIILPVGEQYKETFVHYIETRSVER